MSNERIDLTQLETQYAEDFKAANEATKNACMDFQLEYEMMNLIAELKRCYEEIDEYDKLVGLLIQNHFVETSPYETVKHLIETHQDYKASE